ncbi:MAG: MBL fold metallo-hydrolase [Acidobacteria bacterium RIFCSPLOWO2_02_FULL_61_28]|nr:MAG: MBL fold metallo-hydrolase [Acidobacteria bacterium RIFCSPLOWO2_02_FULL_61_28]
MANIHEIAPDLYRISIYVPEFDLQFNHFLVRDEEPLLFHTGYKGFFPQLREAVATVLEPSKIRWISFSHFESDECGALNHWLEVAPAAQAACSVVGALVSLNDFAIRPPRGLADGEAISTGKYRFRFCSTAHLPHGWDAGVLFEETQRTLLCSDLFHHTGDVEPLTESDIVGRSRAAMTEYQKGPLANYVPYTPLTGRIIETLAALKPKTLATMHGSSFRGDGERALHDLGVAFRDTFGKP